MVRALPAVKHRDKLKRRYPHESSKIELTPSPPSGNNKYVSIKSTGPGAGRIGEDWGQLPEQLREVCGVGVELAPLSLDHKLTLGSSGC